MIKIIIFLLFTISFFSYAQVKENDSINKIVETQIQEVGYMAAFFRQVKIGVLTLTLEKKQ